MPSIKQIYAATKWEAAQRKVNSSVAILAKYGLGYSRTEGIIGSIDGISKGDQKKIATAAVTMEKYQAGFYPDRQKFTPEQAVQTARYTPLNTADYLIAQENALKQARRSPQLAASIKFLQRTIYDARLQAHPNRRALGITPDAAQEWSATVESLWNMDKDSKEWDEALINSYPQLADQNFWNYKAIGEFFCIRRAYSDPEERTPGLSLQNIHPYQVQSPNFYSLVPSLICNSTGTVLANARTYLAELPKGNYIESGIEYNAKGQEVAIFIAPADGISSFTRIPVRTASGFQQVLHGFIQNEPGQKRGIPEAAYFWHEFCNIADMQLFELESARLNSSIAGTVTADSNAQSNGKTPMNDLGNPAGWDGLVNGTGTALPPYTDPSYSVRKVDSGGFIVQNFTPGYKYTELNTSRPNVSIPNYIEKLLEFIYPAIDGLSVVTVKQRFDNSYNASKGAIDLSWQNGVEYHLKQFESDYHRPNYVAWLNAKIAQGVVSAPGWNKKALRAAWSDMQIIPPPKPSLNPLNEAKGAKLRVDELLSNRELEAQQITGTSAEENAERLTVENEKLAIARRPLNQDKIDLVLAKNETADAETDGDENGNVPPEQGEN